MCSASAVQHSIAQTPRKAAYRYAGLLNLVSGPPDQLYVQYKCSTSAVQVQYKCSTAVHGTNTGKAAYRYAGLLNLVSEVLMAIDLNLRTSYAFETISTFLFLIRYIFCKIVSVFGTKISL